MYSTGYVRIKNKKECYSFPCKRNVLTGNPKPGNNRKKMKTRNLMRLAISVRIWKVKLRMEIEK